MALPLHQPAGLGPATVTANTTALCADCARPDGWCTGDETAMATNVDCDGDGKLDWTCAAFGGQRWALLSSRGCDPSYDFGGYAPVDICPVAFGE